MYSLVDTYTLLYIQSGTRIERYYTAIHYVFFSIKAYIQQMVPVMYRMTATIVR